MHVDCVVARARVDVARAVGPGQQIIQIVPEDRAPEDGIFDGRVKPQIHDPRESIPPSRVHRVDAADVIEPVQTRVVREVHHVVPAAAGHRRRGVDQRERVVAAPAVEKHAGIIGIVSGEMRLERAHSIVAAETAQLDRGERREQDLALAID